MKLFINISCSRECFNPLLIFHKKKYSYSILKIGKMLFKLSNDSSSRKVFSYVRTSLYQKYIFDIEN